MNDFLSNLFSETNNLYNHYIQLNHGANHKVESTDANGNKVKHLRGYNLLDFPCTTSNALPKNEDQKELDK